MACRTTRIPGFGPTFADSLVGLVDSARGMSADLGLRMHDVYLVWVGWTADVDGDGIVSARPIISGGMSADARNEAIAELDLANGTIGVGRPVVLAIHEIQPPPRVGSVSGVSEDVDSLGRTETGSIRVDRISASYSEDFLLGLVSPFRDPAHPSSLLPGIEFGWEIVERRGAGFVSPGYEAQVGRRRDIAPVRRRYIPSSQPDPSPLEWSVTLEHAEGMFDRAGQIVR